MEAKASQLEYAQLNDRGQTEAYLQTRPDMFVYSLGDLEDDFWPYTRWYGALEGGEIKAICLMFSKYDPPIVQAVSEPENSAISGLLSAIADELPDYSHIHLAPCVEGALVDTHELTGLGIGWKMALRDRSKLEGTDVSSVERLNDSDIDALRELHDAAYSSVGEPNVFYPFMLDVGPYFGVRRNDRLVSAAGVHVYSPRFGVAAVANVATHPKERGRGLASAVTARLCQELASNVEHIGLNVGKSNEPALRAYRSIGFETVTSFSAGDIRRRK